MLRKIFPLVLILVMAVFSAQAFASIVSVWDYTVTAEFSAATFTNSPNPANHTSTFPATSLVWGTGGQSSLVIDPYAVTSQVTTYIGGGLPDSSYWAHDISLTHNNYPISPPTLTQATLSTNVTLSTGSVVLPEQEFSFDIRFLETPNSGSHPSDIFALMDDFPDFNFTYDSQDYYVNLFAADTTSLEVLPNAAALLIGVPLGTTGFVTREGASTTLPFAFTISTEPIIPEPSMLFLLGLLGFGFYIRRKK